LQVCAARRDNDPPLIIPSRRSMTLIPRPWRVTPWLIAAIAVLCLTVPSAQTTQTQTQMQKLQPPKYPGLPSETPPTFKPTLEGFDYARRDVMIPMRDGVKLHTVILVPNGAKRAPILLTRTPYNATALTTHAESTHLASALNGYDNATDVI